MIFGSSDIKWLKVIVQTRIRFRLGLNERSTMVDPNVLCSTTKRLLAL